MRFTPQEDQRVHEANKQAGTPEDTRPRNAPPPESKMADAKPTLKDYFWPLTVAAPTPTPTPAPPAPVDPPKRSRSLPGVGNGRASATATYRPRQIKTTVRSSRQAPPEDLIDSDADSDAISTQCAPELAAAASCPEILPTREWRSEGGSGGTTLGASVKDEFKAEPFGVYRRYCYELHRWHCDARAAVCCPGEGEGEAEGRLGKRTAEVINMASASRSTSGAGAVAMADDIKAEPFGVLRRCGYEFHRWHCDAASAVRCPGEDEAEARSGKRTVEFISVASASRSTSGAWAVAVTDDIKDEPSGTPMRRTVVVLVIM
jgi:hypothetical protein